MFCLEYPQKDDLLCLMPELPEVETVTRALNRFLINNTITAINIHVDKLRYKLELESFDGQLPSNITAIRRRAKYIIVELSNKNGFLIHLGMTGSFRLESIHERRQKHDHVEFLLDDSQVLRYNDPRRFGFIKMIELPAQGEDPVELPKLAPEPFSEKFNISWLQKACMAKSKPIKNLIMDNAYVVGVGNIYASESLFRAGIHPLKPAGSLSRPRLKRLLKAILEVLEQAIEAGGTTIINFTSINSQEGYFSQELNVYDRFGEFCNKCNKGRIQRLILAGRSTYFCKVCQR